MITFANEMEAEIFQRPDDLGLWSVNRELGHQTATFGSAMKASKNRMFCFEGVLSKGLDVELDRGVHVVESLFICVTLTNWAGMLRSYYRNAT